MSGRFQVNTDLEYRPPDSFTKICSPEITHLIGLYYFIEKTRQLPKGGTRSWMCPFHRGLLGQSG